MFIEYPPTVVYGGEHNVLRWSQYALFNAPLKEIWVFNGLDRGDIVEMDTEIWDHHPNRPLYLRSEHKETVQGFDAWRYHRLDPAPYVHIVRVYGACRYNGQNPYKSSPTCRPHWGVYLNEEPPNARV